METHFQQLHRWLQMESEAESQRLSERRTRMHDADVERSGETLLGLAIQEIHSGLAGRLLCTLVKRDRSQGLPWNRLKVGSPVVVTSQPADGGENYQAVVSRRSPDQIQVALDRWPEGDRFRIDLSPDEVTRRRQHGALAKAETATGRLGQLRDVLLGEREPRFRNLPGDSFSTTLNASQHEAVRFALSADDVAIIHGPPGTGKTTTVVELIRLAVQAGGKVLATAPSNTAVDNLLERLVAAGVRTVRLGHPARINEVVREHALDNLVEIHENMRVVREIRREIENGYRQLDRHTRAQPKRGARQAMRAEIRQLKSEARWLEQQAIQHVVDQSDVICTTTTGDLEVLGDRMFDLAVVDEACQSTEPGCWIPLLRSTKLVLAGDHCQLPPTVIATAAGKEGFQRSLLERLIAQSGEGLVRRLDVQYRMHQTIMDFSSQQFYDGTLVAHDSVRAHLLKDLPLRIPDALTESPITYLDSAGAGWEEELEPDGSSRCNPQEARLVLKKVQQLLLVGMNPRDIAVIAPYAAQVRMLRDLADCRELEIDTVDGFQGREMEAVLISLVRSNPEREIGFLADIRRMNVALTRARRKLIIVGDSATLAVHPFYHSLFEYFERVEAYHTVWEEIE